MNTGEEYTDDIDSTNPEVEKLISEFNKEKSDPITIAVGESIFEYKQDDPTQKQLDNSIKSLKKWGEDPFNCNIQEYGKAFEVLTKGILEKIFENKLSVRYSPSKLDFTPNRNPDPSIDIMIGQNIEQGFEPIFFVRTSLSQEEKPLVHNTLETPVISLCGKKCLNRAENILIQRLANIDNINDFFKNTNNTFGKYFVNEILTNIYRLQTINDDKTIKNKLKIVEDILNNYRR